MLTTTTIEPITLPLTYVHRVKMMKRMSKTHYFRSLFSFSLTPITLPLTHVHGVKMMKRMSKTHYYFRSFFSFSLTNTLYIAVRTLCIPMTYIMLSEHVYRIMCNTLTTLYQFTCNSKPLCRHSAMQLHIVVRVYPTSFTYTHSHCIIKQAL